MLSKVCKRTKTGYCLFETFHWNFKLSLLYYLYISSAPFYLFPRFNSCLFIVVFPFLYIYLDKRIDETVFRSKRQPETTISFCLSIQRNTSIGGNRKTSQSGQLSRERKTPRGPCCLCDVCACVSTGILVSVCVRVLCNSDVEKQKNKYRRAKETRGVI